MPKRSRRTTIEDVAKRAGVSAVTVSRVANKQRWVSVETQSRVESAIKELDYRPNIAARSMRNGSTKSVGFIMADLTNSFNALVAETAQSVLFDAGYIMMVASTKFDTDREGRIINLFEERQADGLLLSLTNDDDPGVINHLSKLSTPCVALDRDVPAKFDAVLFDHESSICSAVQYLSSLGHKKIALIAASPQYRVGRERYNAFRKAMQSAGLSCDPKLIRNVRQSSEYAFLETLSFLSSSTRPTAIIAAGNQILFGALKAINASSLKIPDDISVIGADEPELTDLFSPPVTILDRDIRFFAKTAAGMLIERLDGSADGPGRKIHLPTKLMIRASCAAPARKRKS